MGTRTRRLALFLSVLVFVGFGLFRFVTRLNRPDPHRLERLHRQRVDDFVAILGQETFQESVSNLLTDRDRYSYPGFVSQIKGDQGNLLEMLSNRRCLKVIEQLAALPAIEREAQCSQIFDHFLDVHVSAIQVALIHAEDPTKPENKQSLWATQLSICAVMFASAKFGSTDELLREKRKLDDSQAAIQHQLLERRTPFSPSFVLAMQRYAVPDHRCLLNLLYMQGQRQGAPIPERIGVICRGLVKGHLPITKWDASVTYFDLAHRMGRVPIDTAAGGMDVEVYAWPEEIFDDYDAQRHLIDQIQEVLQNPK